MTICSHCFDRINPDHFDGPLDDTVGDYCAECHSLPACNFCGDKFATTPVYVGDDITCSLLCARIIRDTPDHEPWKQADLDATTEQTRARRAAMQRAAAERDHRRALASQPAWSDDTECPI